VRNVGFGAWIGAAVLLGVWLAVTAPRTEAHVTKCPPPQPVPCIPTVVETTRVWFVSLLRADGHRGNVLVSAPTWDAAGSAAASLSGAEPQTIRAETFTLNEVSWDDQ
jgi:hypothetical protein